MSGLAFFGFVGIHAALRGTTACAAFCGSWPLRGSFTAFGLRNFCVARSLCFHSLRGLDFSPPQACDEGLVFRALVRPLPSS